MRFQIQTIDSHVEHDFGHVLIEAIKFNHWSNKNDYSYFLTSSISLMRDTIPVGSVKFVQDYLYRVYDKLIKPRNVPNSLFSYAGRFIYNGDQYDLMAGDYFVKSHDVIKRFAAKTPDSLPEGRYQFSTWAEFSSEWRAFVWRGELVGLQNYTGDFTEFPSIQTIKAMITVFKDAPCAYTLDVGIREGGTFVVEVHDFFSCGLYGFDDPVYLPLMLGGWFKEFIR
jgi:hypothetical protein